MVLIRNGCVPALLQRAVVTIGNFDGVHVGHQALIAALKARAKVLGRPCGVILFEPQPQEFFSRNPPARLSSLRQKYQLLKQQGIDFIMVLRFNRQLAHLSAQDFIDQILWQQLQVSELFIGQDFRFGFDKLGDVALLQQAAEHYGFGLHIQKDIKLGDARISSTQIRSALAAGDLEQARNLLGRFFMLSGRVVPGDARGRTLNMPTANLAMPHQVPLQGIFVVRVRLHGKFYPGVASLGTRPVFAGHAVILEVHVLDFNQDIYGERLDVEFLHKLRDEADFVDVASLSAQMQRDASEARTYWRNHVDEL